jgi:hypothetical protein
MSTTLSVYYYIIHFRQQNNVMRHSVLLHKIHTKSLNNFVRRLYITCNMLNEIVSGFKKVFARKELVIAVVVLLIAAALLSYSNSKSFSMDGLADGQRSGSAGSSYSDQTNLLAREPTVLETSAQNAVGAKDPAALGNNYNMRPVNSVSDLLPNDPNSEWAKLNPGLNAGATPDLLSPGQYIGINRSPLRNSNLQYRSDPVIQRQDIGPWNQSTIDQDISRIPLEIGYTGAC